MITAGEALQLDSAKLTEAEIEAANKLEGTIEEFVRKEMKFYGCTFDGKETDPNVLAEVNRRLKAAGYTPEWKYLIQQHPLNAAKSQVIGFQVLLTPGDAAYRTTLS